MLKNGGYRNVRYAKFGLGIQGIYSDQASKLVGNFINTWHCYQENYKVQQIMSPHAILYHLLMHYVWVFLPSVHAFWKSVPFL